jgi:hypothetical protein
MRPIPALPHDQPRTIPENTPKASHFLQTALHPFDLNRPETFNKYRAPNLFLSPALLSVHAEGAPLCPQTNQLLSENLHYNVAVTQTGPYNYEIGHTSSSRFRVHAY